MRVQPGRIANEAAMVRALKTRGEYRSGVPRPAERTEPKREPRKPKPAFRYLSSKELQRMDNESFQRYINDRVNAEKE